VKRISRIESRAREYEGQGLRLTELQKKLCNELQKGLPVCSRPFAEIAKDLNCDEKEVLQQTRELKNAGVIRRIRALTNYHALGRASTLVTAHVPQENLQAVAEAVNSLNGVSHNYLRDHHYNLWFTLQAQTAAQIDLVLSDLSGRFGIDFHSLPVKRTFKLAVRFDTEGEDQTLLEGVELDAVPKPMNQPWQGGDSDKLILEKLQDELAITSEPFAFLCGGGMEAEDVLRIITELIDKGVIRRIAAVVDHRKVGFVANAMFAAEVPQNRIVRTAKRLAGSGIVSHCYERETFENWPYNLFGMMHGRSMGQIQRVVNEFIKAEKIDSFQLLSTTAELKKQPVKHKFH
jgi:DNA-binding Lrp family transcriptional regulator